MKRCPKCAQYKSEDNFVKDKSRKDGLHPHCNECRKVYKKISREKNKKKRSEYMKKYYQDNRDVLLERSKNYQMSDEQKKNAIKKSLEWKKNNPDKIKEYKYGSSQRKIRTHLSKMFAKKIKKNGKGTCQIMEEYLGYTLQELYDHLESQFEEGMNWDNYGSGDGKWCIDHRTPDSWFNYSSYEDYDFRKCWSLDNLKPMWFEKNSSKGNRYKD